MTKKYYCLVHPNDQGLIQDDFDGRVYVYTTRKAAEKEVAKERKTGKHCEIVIRFFTK